MSKKTVCDVMDARLSGIRITEKQKNAIMLRIREEEKPVKRKVSTIILVAALVLALLSATAFAVGLFRTAESEAIQRARVALGNAYGLTPPTLGLFYTGASRNGDTWEVTFRSESSDGIDGERIGTYTVTLTGGLSPTVSWTHDDLDKGLWQGRGLDAPAWGQAQMLEALIRKGNANAARDAAYAGEPQKESAAEPGGIAGDVKTAMVTAANRALIEQYGFTEATLRLFSAQAQVSETGNGGDIDVVYMPDFEKNPVLQTEKMGRYYVTLRRESAELVQTRWSEASAWDDKAYTQSDWGSAPAFHAKLLPWMLELFAKVEALVAPTGLDWLNPMTVYDLSLPDKGAYDQLFRDAGFSDGYYRTVPDKDDIPYEKANEIARRTLLEDMSLTDEKLDAAYLNAERYLNENNIPVYWFNYYTHAEGYDEVYYVIMDARTGEILTVDVGTGGNG